MAKQKNQNLLTVTEAQEIIDEQKTTVREMEWIPKRTVSNPQWIEYVSACRIKSEIREDLMFRAQYRAGRILSEAGVLIETAEIFNAAITVGPYRIIALDTADTPHRNKCGKDLPYYQQTIYHRTHRHIWTDEGYGYAEPVEPSLDDVESLINAFVSLANLDILGGMKHPLLGQQMGLL